MPTFEAFDGTTLAYHVIGTGDQVICLPGGPMQDTVYLGDLGGLSADRQLIKLDLRGTGGSAIPVDSSSYRCDRLVDDVEAIRQHLGLERIDLLAHSAGTNLAARYVERFPARVSNLALITPSVAAVPIEISSDLRLEIAQLRRGEPWFEDAFAALGDIMAGNATDGHWEAVAPFWYGRWDDEAQAQRAAEVAHKNQPAAAVFGAEGAFDPATTGAALATFDRPVLVLAGEVDLNSPPRAMAEVAALFPAAELVTQTRAGHFPWLDDPVAFVATLRSFLSSSDRSDGHV